ncbi:MAG: hypothetical protein Q7U97_05715 [Rhodocyclaceae bacterium]|jgi:hypothetical protein|nr:hypothetical protein [Rhodocyclaceae bacterium]
MTRPSREVAENVRRLAASPACSAAVREQAEEVRGLLELVATWPVPPSLNIGDDIRTQLFGLCRSSGFVLCRQPQCVAPGGDVRKTPCPVVLP